MKIAEDPHHNGDNLWCVIDGRLFHKNRNEDDWDKVKQISYTPDRIKTIAQLVYRAEGRKERQDIEDELKQLNRLHTKHFQNNY